MRATATAITALTLVVFAGLAPEAATRPPVTITNASVEEAERVEWALERFEQAELRLPPLDITFHEGGGGCAGHTGLFRLVDGVGDIEICMPTKHLILHELAHAWESVNVEVSTRAAVMAYWGLENWNDHNHGFAERGGERAADAIAFALNDPPEEPNERLARFLCTYELLTGAPAPAQVSC